MCKSSGIANRARYRADHPYQCGDEKPVFDGARRVMLLLILYYCLERVHIFSRKKVLPTFKCQKVKNQFINAYFLLFFACVLFVNYCTTIRPVDCICPEKIRYT